jgi:hypothetical protein
MKKLKFVPLQAQLRKLAYDAGNLSALLHEAGVARKPANADDRIAHLWKALGIKEKVPGFVDGTEAYKRGAENDRESREACARAVEALARVPFLHG